MLFLQHEAKARAKLHVEDMQISDGRMKNLRLSHSSFTASLERG
jgi:hypothetical protein